MQIMLPSLSVETVPPPSVQALGAFGSLGLSRYTFDLLEFKAIEANAPSIVSANTAKATTDAHNIGDSFMFTLREKLLNDATFVAKQGESYVSTCLFLNAIELFGYA